MLLLADSLQDGLPFYSMDGKEEKKGYGLKVTSVTKLVSPNLIKVGMVSDL